MECSISEEERNAKQRQGVRGRRRRVARTQGLQRERIISGDRCLEIHRLMALGRAMEERMIKMSKSGQGYFWIGGPGEEAFNVCLGLQVKKGCGPAFDFLHLHYRNSAALVAMGMPVVEGLRQMAMKATDTHSMGRNFIGHFSVRDWNVVPVTSVIEVQYTMAPGTALVQKRSRRRRHHHCHRRRRGHGGRRFCVLHGLEYPTWK